MAEGTPARPRPRPGRIRSLVRRVRAQLTGLDWWTAVTAGALGDGIRVAAIPLATASVSRDPSAVAGSAVAVTLPFLLFAPLAGIIVDRVDRRLIMIAVSAVRGLVLALLGVVVLTGALDILELYLVALVAGVGETLFDNAAQSILPSLVSEERLDAANGRMIVSFTVGYEFFGPALGAYLFSLAPFAPFLAAGGLGLGAASCSWRLPPAKPARRADETRSALQQVRRELAEGFTWIWRERRLRRLALVGGVLGLTDSAWYAVLVLYVIEAIRLPQSAYGALVAIAGVGGVAGGFVAPRLSRLLGSRRSIAGTVAGCGCAQLTLGLTSSVPVVVVALAASSFLFAVFSTLAVSMRQRATPEPLLGRVNAVFRFVGLGSAPFGAAIGGLLASSIGIRAPFLVSVPVVLAAAILALRSADR
jgi:MFS family permease